MRVIPRSRRIRIAAVVLVVAVVASSPLWWSSAKFLYKLVFPDRFYAAAAERSSEPAALGPAVPLPTTGGTPAAAGTDPSISRRQIASIEGPSAVADPPGAGPVLLTTLAGEGGGPDRPVAPCVRRAPCGASPSLRMRPPFPAADQRKPIPGRSFQPRRTGRCLMPWRKFDRSRCTGPANSTAS